MSNPFANDIDHSQPEWGYTLGWRFLDAAELCGYVCDRKFVADGQVAEPPPPNTDCTCQLSVVVTPGLSQPQSDAESDLYCLPVFTADVTLAVDLCVLLPGSDEATDPDLVDAKALENQKDLWRIMQGLMKARSDGSLFGMGAKITVGGWEPAGHAGGSARWQTRWSYRA